MNSAKYTRNDFTNKTEVRWCPGCGDYAILAALQRVLPDLGLAPEQHVFISGIGCAGRLPYYMNTYGFHTIHGRAPAVATGLKVLRDDLCVWVITGDGDALSIGGNHLIHCLRRNVDVKILLFNNQVYGLTKGQFSPTSPTGQTTKTSPYGVKQQPFNPLVMALAAGASFVARCVDKDPVHLGTILKEAAQHQGSAFVEIYQDCNIFNHGAFDAFALKEHRATNTLILQSGKPLIFGAAQQEGITFEHDQPQKVAADRAMMHQENNVMAATRLAKLAFPAFPVPLGVYYRESRPVFSLAHPAQKQVADLAGLYRSKAHVVHEA